MTPLGGVEVSGTHLDGNRLIYSFPISIHFFSGLKNGHKMMVSDLNHSLGRIESSDLVQNGRNYSPDVVGGLYWPRSDKPRSYHSGASPKNTHWGSFGPLEGFFGRKSVLRKSLEDRLGPDWAEHLCGCCGSAVVSPLVINHGHINWGTSPKTRFRAHLGLCGPPEASGGQTRHTRVGIKAA